MYSSVEFVILLISVLLVLLSPIYVSLLLILLLFELLSSFFSVLSKISVKLTDKQIIAVDNIIINVNITQLHLLAYG